MTKEKPPCPHPEAQIARQFPWETMTPEEFSARHGAGVSMFSLDRYRYENQKLEAWLVRFGEIGRDVKKMEACRKKYLTPDEQRAYDQYIADLISGRIEY